MYLKNYALITGASSGIGKALAVALAREKFNLLLVALPNTGLQEVSSQLAAEYRIETKYFEVDLTEPQAAATIADWVKKSNVSLRILINNAGIGTQLPFAETEGLLLEHMLRLNNHAMVMLTHHLLPELKRHAPSYLLNVGSLASFMSIPGKAVYGASKSFVYSFSTALRLELRSSGVQVSCLCPGGTYTSARVLRNMAQIGPVGKCFMQQPEEVAQEAVRGMIKGRHVIIPGWWNRLLLDLYRMLPGWLVQWMLLVVFDHPKKETCRMVRRPAGNPTAALAFVGW